VLGVVWLVAACAAPNADLQELLLPPQPIIQTGYSFLPPNEKGWLVGERSPARTVLMKRGTGTDETYVVQSMLLRLAPYRSREDFVNQFRESQGQDIDPARHKVLRHDAAYEDHRGTDCARSHILAEDNAAAKADGSKGTMTMEIVSMACAHPKDKSVGVFLGYSQRYHAGRRDKALDAKAAAVLDSMEFIGR
jgi:hypothetical protein